MNGKDTDGDEITEIRIKCVGYRVVDWIWRQGNMTFKSSDAFEDWRSAVVVPLYKGKGERNVCKNCRGICLLSVVGKIYAGILVDRFGIVIGV